MKTIDFRTLLDNSALTQVPTSTALSGNELDELISPVACEEFVNTYFSKNSLNVEGSSTKFNKIFSWERLKQALKRGESITDNNYNISASFTGGEDSGDARVMIEAYHSQVIELLSAGATVCISNIQIADPFLAKWALAICGQLNFSGTVGINCYISPDGSGLPMHYDSRVATTLQIEGKKRWKYSTKSAKPWPSSNVVYQEGQNESDVGTLPADMEFCEVELNPGDMLCLPAGAWHSARGVGYSLALNLSFSPRNYLEQLLPVLNKFATSNSDWRGGPPATAGKIQGCIPPEVTTYMSDRLEEFHKITQESLDSPDKLVEPWLTSLTHASYTGGINQIRPIPDIRPDQLFNVAKPPLRYIEFQECLLISFNNDLHRFPVNLAPIFQQLSSEPLSFTIPGMLSLHQNDKTLTQNEIIHYMQVLYKFGIIDKA
jgi:hypothetical protein